jgi:hypothetical protein
LLNSGVEKEACHCHPKTGQAGNGQIRTLQRRIKPCGRSDCQMFEMPIIRAVGTYFSLSELAMMRHSGVMP